MAIRKNLTQLLKEFGKDEYQSRVQMVSTASFFMSLRRKRSTTPPGKMNMPSTQMVPICDRSLAPIHVHRYDVVGSIGEYDIDKMIRLHEGGSESGVSLREQ